MGGGAKSKDKKSAYWVLSRRKNIYNMGCKCLHAWSMRLVASTFICGPFLASIGPPCYDSRMSAAKPTVEIADEVVELTRILSPDEDNFALAVIEYGGNIRAAYISVYGEHTQATAKGRELMTRPHIAARIAELNGTLRESALISIESHMIELANIRDLAKVSGSLKVALAAERSRGEVAGFYVTRVQENLPQVPGVDRLNRLADRLITLQRNIVNQGAVDVPHQVVQV